MPLEYFIITVFCILDDELEKMLSGKKLRQRGRRPSLTDSEVISMEVIGEYLGIDCDKSIWEYFKSYWIHFFPSIPDRSNFIKQAANLHEYQTHVASKTSGFIKSICRQTSYH